HCELHRGEHADDQHQQDRDRRAGALVVADERLAVEQRDHRLRLAPDRVRLPDHDEDHVEQLHPVDHAQHREEEDARAQQRHGDGDELAPVRAPSIRAASYISPGMLRSPAPSTMMLNPREDQIPTIPIATSATHSVEVQYTAGIPKIPRNWLRMPYWLLKIMPHTRAIAACIETKGAKKSTR